MSLILSGTDGLSDVDGTAATPAIRGTDADTGIFFGTDIIGFSEGGVEAARIDASGNFGLGVAAPQNKLQVVTTTRPQFSVSYNGTTGLYLEDSTASVGKSWKIATSTAVASALEFYQSTATSGVPVWSASAAMTLDASGRLLVGATSTSSYFDGAINGFNSTTPGVCAKTGTVGTFAVTVWNTGTSSNNQFISFGTEGSFTERGTIDYNRGGGLTRYNTTSDATLKNIIGDANSQRSLEILSTTRIREYAWKDDEAQKPQIGVIAQELYETYKGAVSVGGDVQKTDEEGNVVTEYKSWGVDKTAFTFHLIKGWQEHERIIQEQQALITQLTARITALESA